MSHLRKRDWVVVSCNQREAREFIEKIHYTGGCPNTAVARHALRHVDGGAIQGVTLWLPPTKVAAMSVAWEDWRGVLSLSRLCVAEGMPTNAASFLLGRSMKMLDRSTWHTLLTYADTRQGHTGAIYRATNWECLGEVKGYPTWRHRETGQIRGQKRGPRNLSVVEMVELGFERLPALPKVKFVHRVGRRAGLE